MANEQAPPPKVSDRDFARSISKPRTAPTDPTIQKNKDHATEELNYIFSLRDNSAFDWFMREGLLPILNEADQKIKTAPDEEISKWRARWRAAAELHDFLTKREIVHRRQLDSNDAELVRLHERLLLKDT
jgi:hypothetical protein